MKISSLMIVSAFSLASILACGNKKADRKVPAEETLVAQESLIDQIYGEEGDDTSFPVTVLADETAADGSRHISARPSGVCSSQIDVVVKDGVIQEVVFTGGCPGNTHGVSVLVKGMKVQEAVSKLEGIDCGGRGTSCPDQLSKVLKLFLR